MCACMSVCALTYVCMCMYSSALCGVCVCVIKYMQLHVFV